MEQRKILGSVMLLSLLSLTVVSLRLYIDIPNVAPIAAMALLAPSFMGRSRVAFLLPILIMVAGDFFLGWHGTIPFVYGSYLLIVLLGFSLHSRWQDSADKKHSVARSAFWLGGYTLLGAVAFFVVTNLGVWLLSGMYSPTWSGLLKCYTMALPFFRNSLVGNLVFGYGFAAVYFVLSFYMPLLRPWALIDSGVRQSGKL